MHTKILLILFSFFTLVSCTKDKTKSSEDKNSLELLEPQSVISEKHIQLIKNISSAHNASKFMSENEVKYNIKLSLKDSLFCDGFMSLKTKGNQLEYRDNSNTIEVFADKLDENMHKKLFWIAELYSLGFWLENFQLLDAEKNDSLVWSKYKSSKTNTTYKIYTHPITNVIQQVDYNTDIKDSPFDSGKILFSKYITVNRIPVALKWYILKGKDTIANADISRISYPKM